MRAMRPLCRARYEPGPLRQDAATIHTDIVDLEVLNEVSQIALKVRLIWGACTCRPLRVPLSGLAACLRGGWRRRDDVIAVASGDGSETGSNYASLTISDN
jgi:hypothetical protein